MEYPNWFGNYAARFFAHHLTPLAGRPELRFLQVGVFTGDASVWLVEHILTGPGSLLVDVDTWEGSDEPVHEAFDWDDVEATYDERTSGLPILKFKGSSADYLRTCATTGFDFIYIDGDHTAAGVLDDAMGAFPLLKRGGLIAFDDYLWKSGKGDVFDPALGIDTFANMHAEHLERLEGPEMPGAGPLQVWFRRIA